MIYGGTKTYGNAVISGKNTILLSNSEFYGDTKYIDGVITGEDYYMEELGDYDIDIADD